MSASLLAGLIITAVAIGYVIAPLIWPERFGARRGEGAIDRLPGDEARPLEDLRDELYARIVDLDFEHAVGKTDEEEYRQERDALKRRALAVLRSLDERDRAISSVPRAQTAGLDSADDEIEREVRLARARRAAQRPAGGVDVAVRADDGLEDAIEREVLALRRSRPAPAPRTSQAGRQ